MKRDIQVGVILGVIILAIIGVFLSTRTAVKEPIIAIPEVEEGLEVSELNVNELPKDTRPAKESFKEVTTVAKNAEQKESASTAIHPAKTNEQPDEKDNNVIELEWKKAKGKEPGNVATTEIETAASSNKEDWKDIPTSDTEKSTSKLQIHKVQQRDDLYKIAKKYYGDANKWLLIYNTNHDKIFDRNSLKIGTELIIPEENTPSQKAKKETVTPSLSQVVNVEDTKSISRKHKIQQGDSLYKLAVKYYNDGTKWNKIADANKELLQSQKTLKIGQEIAIPDL
ncbi:MAG TPA: LysM peptidoglycan-binding domain-containing protein [Candidatus Brocadiaceae bacterium]